MSDIFEKASRKALRIKTKFGVIGVEELWALKLVDLNVCAVALSKQVKAAKEESFLEEVGKVDAATALSFEVVQHIITVKLREEKARKSIAAARIRKQHLLRVLADKKDAVLAEMSIDELNKELSEVGDLGEDDGQG